MTTTLLKRTCESTESMSNRVCGKPAVEKLDEAWLCQEHVDWVANCEATIHEELKEKHRS